MNLSKRSPAYKDYLFTTTTCYSIEFMGKQPHKLNSHVTQTQANKKIPRLRQLVIWVKCQLNVLWHLDGVDDYMWMLEIETINEYT